MVILGLRKIFKKKIFKNFSYLIVGNMISQLLSLITILKITQKLIPEEFGFFSFLSVQGLLIVSISGLGLKNIIVRSIARDPSCAKNVVVNGLVLKFFALIIVFIFYLLYNDFYGTLTSFHILLIFSFALTVGVFDIFQNVFFGREEMLFPSLVVLFYSFSWFVSVLVIPEKYFNSSILFCIYLILNVTKTLLCLIFVKRNRILFGKRDKLLKTSQKLIKESSPYFLLTLIMLPFTMLPNNFLTINSTLQEVGYFNLAQKILGPISLVIDLALVSIFPNLSALWLTDRKKFELLIATGFKYFLILSLLLCLLFTLFSGEFISLLFSNKYFATIKISQLQIWYLFLASIDSLIGTILGAVNKEKVILRLGISKAIFCTPFLFFGSKYGAMGLSYGFIISVSIFQIYLWRTFTRNVRVKIRGMGIIWIVVIACFIFSFVFSAKIPLFSKLTIGLAAIGYTGFYIYKNYKSSLII